MAYIRYCTIRKIYILNNTPTIESIICVTFSKFKLKSNHLFTIQNLCIFTNFQTNFQTNCMKNNLQIGTVEPILLHVKKRVKIKILVDGCNKHPSFRGVYMYTQWRGPVPCGNADRSIVGWVRLDRRGENEKRDGKCPASLVNRDSPPLRKERMIKGKADSIFYCAVSRIASGVKFHLAAGTEPSLSSHSTSWFSRVFARGSLATRETGFDTPRPRSNTMRRRLFVEKTVERGNVV